MGHTVAVKGSRTPALPGAAVPLGACTPAGVIFRINQAVMPPEIHVSAPSSGFIPSALGVSTRPTLARSLVPLMPGQLKAAGCRAVWRSPAGCCRPAPASGAAVRVPDPSLTGSSLRAPSRNTAVEPRQAPRSPGGAPPPPGAHAGARPAADLLPRESPLPLPLHAQGGRRPGEAVSAHIKRCRRAGQR